MKKPKTLRSIKSHSLLISEILVFLFGLVFGVLILAFFSGEILYDYDDAISLAHGEQGPLPQVDVIVCLAGGRGRIAEASQLWMRYQRQSKNTKLYIAGMGNQANWGVFIKQVDPEIVKVLPKDQVILETVSSNTIENAKLFVEFAKHHHWKSLALVTASYHMKRSSYLFKEELKANGFQNVRIYPASLIQEPFNKENWKKSIYGVQVTLFEFLKWVYTRAVY